MDDILDGKEDDISSRSDSGEFSKLLDRSFTEDVKLDIFNPAEERACKHEQQDNLCIEAEQRREKFHESFEGFPPVVTFVKTGKWGQLCNGTHDRLSDVVIAHN